MALSPSLSHLRSVHPGLSLFLLQLLPQFSHLTVKTTQWQVSLSLSLSLSFEFCARWPEPFPVAAAAPVQPPDREDFSMANIPERLCQVQSNLFDASLTQHWSLQSLLLLFLEELRIGILIGKRSQKPRLALPLVDMEVAKFMIVSEE